MWHGGLLYTFRLLLLVMIPICGMGKYDTVADHTSYEVATELRQFGREGFLDERMLTIPLTYYLPALQQLLLASWSRIAQHLSIEPLAVDAFASQALDSSLSLSHILKDCPCEFLTEVALLK